MRKLFIIPCILILLSLNAFADVVPESKARKVAENIFGPSTKGNPVLTMVWNGIESQGTKSASSTIAAPFYVFNNESGGFVIVAGDDDVQPILGYSYEFSFSPDNMPENISSWMEKYKNLVQDTRSRKVAPAKDVKSAWIDALSGTKAGAGTPVKDLGTALWNQGSPFNNQCPYDTEAKKNSLTGCVPTATAIVMRYYKWPSKGVGTLDGYTSSKFTIPGKNLDESAGYNWDSMPTKYTSSWTETNINEVSTLMSDCGIGVQADYAAGGTSAFASDIVQFLQNHMKYSRDARYLSFSNYTMSEWISLIKKEISANRPVIYRGTDPSEGGHCFVVDGYDSNNYLKFNWGWGGSGNGYFYMSEIDYRQGESGIFGMRPDESWEDTATGRLFILERPDYNYYGIESSDPYIEKGEIATISFTIKNDNGSDYYSGRIKLIHADKDGNEKESLYENDLELSSGYIITYSPSVTLNETIEEGDELRVAYYYGGKWILIDNASSSHFPLKYKLGKVIKMTYDKSSNTLDIRGLGGFTYSFNGTSGTFDCPSLTLPCPSSGSTTKLTIGNGKETISIDLTF